LARVYVVVIMAMTVSVTVSMVATDYQVLASSLLSRRHALKFDQLINSSASACIAMGVVVVAMLVLMAVLVVVSVVVLMLVFVLVSAGGVMRMRMPAGMRVFMSV
ncbi:hypothetical protein FBU31_007758, partial [Coemansia sp. 'formosensis']